MLGLAVADLGKVPKPSTEPYNWGLPCMVLLVMGVPFACGYFGAKNDE